jgi:hypothetical protein
MRAKLIEFTPERSIAWRSTWSAKAFFTIAWQSSKVPATATQETFFSGAAVMNRRCTSEMRPSGKSATTLTFSRPRNASTAAPPVSPDVAQRMVCLRFWAARTWS